MAFLLDDKPTISMTKHYHFIHEQDALDEWCQKQLNTIDLIALDTEFMRVRTYFPQLCLIQLATRNEVICIDPFNIKDFSSLTAILTAPSITKIIHSCSQDLETLVHSFNILPTPVFDTQIGLSVLGCEHLMSYQEMVATYLDIQLEKDQTRTDWSKRPLSPNQIKYAYDDVEYLIDAYEKIMRLIIEQNRGDELQEATKVLTEIERYQPNPDNAWKKVKRKNLLTGKRLRLLKELARVREHLAIQKNLPKRWVIKDEVLIHLSKNFAQDSASLNKDEMLNTLKESISKLLVGAIHDFWKTQEAG